jgi:hypothetical protein
MRRVGKLEDFFRGLEEILTKLLERLSKLDRFHVKLDDRVCKLHSFVVNVVDGVFELDELLLNRDERVLNVGEAVSKVGKATRRTDANIHTRDLGKVALVMGWADERSGSAPSRAILKAPGAAAFPPFPGLFYLRGSNNTPSYRRRNHRRL